jgi:integrative and conjugative element protein (TIGR02256 family)
VAALHHLPNALASVEMTEGQQLAIEQLRTIQEKASGAFEVVRVSDTPNAIGFLQVEVGLNCSEKIYREGGVQLKRREWFTIAIPPDFPFDIPSTWTRHARFAGLPHVQWKRHLCLYQAPATEWNVADGMFGYIERLDVWLDHAAAGELNPSGEALHPPVAYVTSGITRTVVPRANAPAVTAANWIGFGQLANVSETRADIVRWVTLDDTSAEAPLAPAFLISEPMPYEFPSKMGDLLPELERRGVSISLVIACLRLAVLMNREGDPLFVVLGTPMRGTAGTTDRKFHLAAWYVDPEIVKGLRLSLHKFDPNPRIQELGEQIELIVVDWIKSVDVGWCLVREDRPEIVIARDQGSATAWFKGKTVSLWGCGALGSHLAEYLARGGVRKLILRDKSIVTPGILARQLFSDDDIGKFKVAALASRLKAIRPDIEVEPFTYDLISGPLSSNDWTDGADVVFESTGAGTVMVKAEAARRRNEVRTSFISMALGHTANKAMMLVATTAHSGGPLDVDRKLRQECYRRPELSEFIEEFWPTTARTKVFQPEPGCSDATFVGSAADVAALSAAMLNLAASELSGGQTVAAAHLLAQAPTRTDLSALHKRFSWPADSHLEDPDSGYEVRLSRSAWREVVGWISANDRTRGLNVETGGLLFGERSDLLRTVWVDEASGPPPDSKHSRAGFICGVQGTAELASEKAKRTAELVRFVGMWHTHPRDLPVPSKTDMRAIQQLVKATQTPLGKSLMLIVGGAKRDDYVTAAYVLGTEDVERIRSGKVTRLCSIHSSRGFGD